jgi:hypothetical protein
MIQQEILSHPNSQLNMKQTWIKSCNSGYQNASNLAICGNELHTKCSKENQRLNPIHLWGHSTKLLLHYYYSLKDSSQIQDQKTPKFYSTESTSPHNGNSGVTLKSHIFSAICNLRSIPQITLKSY